MRQRTLASLAGVFVLTLSACEHSSVAVVGPSMNVPSLSATGLESSAEGMWGVTATGVVRTGGQQTDFTCFLGPFGVAERAHFTVSASGNASLVCSGKVTAAPPDKAIEFAAFPCALPSGDVTIDSRAVFTPSGHVSLTCQAKK
jgi:hypothetical protein